MAARAQWGGRWNGGTFLLQNKGPSALGLVVPVDRMLATETLSGLVIFSELPSEDLNTPFPPLPREDESRTQDSHVFAEHPILAEFRSQRVGKLGNQTDTQRERGVGNYRYLIAIFPLVYLASTHCVSVSCQALKIRC